MANVKGSALSSRVLWVRLEYGDAGIQRLLPQCTPALRAELAAGVQKARWYPLAQFVELITVIDRLFGAGDLRLCKELGAWAAQENLPKVFKLFYRLGTPTFVFERAAKLWTAHYDSGRLELASPAEKRAHLSLFDFAEPHRAHCLSVLGWAAKSIELSGAKVVESDEVRCRTRGDDRCELAVAWA